MDPEMLAIPRPSTTCALDGSPADPRYPWVCSNVECNGYDCEYCYEGTVPCPQAKHQ